MPNKPPMHRAKPKPKPPEDDRLSSSRRGYGRAWRRHRLDIFVRDGGRCRGCGDVLGKKVRLPGGGMRDDWQIDHVIPLGRGGTDNQSNLQLLCVSCHSEKTALCDGGFGHKPMGGGA